MQRRDVASESRAARAAAAEALAEKTRSGVGHVYGDPGGAGGTPPPRGEFDPRLRDARELPRRDRLEGVQFLAGIDADVLGLYADAGRYEEAQSYLERPEVKERMGNKALRVGETLQKKRVERDAIATAADIDAAWREEETGWFDEGKAFMLLQHVPTEQRREGGVGASRRCRHGRRQRQADIGARLRCGAAGHAGGAHARA